MEHRAEVEPPSISELRESSVLDFFDHSQSELTELRNLMEGSFSLITELDEIEVESKPPTATRSAETRAPVNDPLNAFTIRCEIGGDSDGVLSGYRVGVKDNIAVAGVELTAGSTVLEEFTPDRDATVVRRLIEAGADIIGKTNMGALALGGSYSATGPILNPRNTNHVAGGSSAGSAAALVSGEIDLALGTDQGGSIRLPAAWSGCVGLKPTHGRVPYTGVLGLGPTFDHVGPMANSVADCARAMDVISGTDGFDIRQHPHQEKRRIGDISDSTEITVGILQEGFGVDGGDERVDEIVQSSINELETSGISTREVSVPMHEHGYSIWSGIVFEELASFIQSDLLGRYRKGWYDVASGEVFGEAWRRKANQLPPALQFVLATGQYLTSEYGGYVYARAQNLLRDLTMAYDRALESVDVLAMPTTSSITGEVNEPESTLAAWRQTNVSNWATKTSNTAPFDVTGHPALSVPCGTVEGLPVGLQFVAARDDDRSALTAGHTFETRVGWSLSQ